MVSSTSILVMQVTFIPVELASFSICVRSCDWAKNPWGLTKSVLTSHVCSRAVLGALMSQRAIVALSCMHPYTTPDNALSGLAGKIMHHQSLAACLDQSLLSRGL